MAKEITQEILKQEVEKKFNQQRLVFLELFKSDDFLRICSKHNTTLVELSNSMISDVFSISKLELNNPEVFSMVDRFLDDVSKKLDVHPSDALLLLTKLFSDMMVQISTLIELQEKNKEDESEEK